MGTADEQRGGGWGSQGVSEEGGSAGEKTLWWDDGQMKKAGGRGGVGVGGEGDGWKGKTLLLFCVAVAPEHCPVPLQHSASSPFV